jgi:O-antigen ligase
LALIGWVLLLTSAFTMLTTGYLPGTRLQVGDENSNGLGISALISLPGVLWNVIGPSRSKRSLHTILAFGYLALTVIVVAASGSRGSAISLLVTLLAMLLFRQTRPWALACFSILVVAVIAAPSLFTTMLVRFLGSAGDTILGGREYIWQAGFRLIADHLFFGVGIGNSSYSVVPYLRMFTNTAQLKSAALHNPVLAILADVGLPGIILYLGIVMSAVWSAFMVFRKQRMEARPYLMAYFSLVSAIFVGFMTSWIKGGGMESAHSLFMMAVMLLIPASLDWSTFRRTSAVNEQGTLA